MNSYVIGQLADIRRDELISVAARERIARTSRPTPARGKRRRHHLRVIHFIAAAFATQR